MRDSSAAAAAIAATFAAGVLTGACLAYAAAPQPPPALPGPREPLPFSLDDEILAEQLARNVQFFGRPSQQNVCDSLKKTP